MRFYLNFLAVILLTLLSTNNASPVAISKHGKLKAILNRNLNQNYVSLSSIHKKSTANEVECYLCKFFIDTLHIVWSSDISKDCIADLVAETCIFMKLQHDHICRTIVSDEKHEVLYVIGELVLEPHQICGLLLDNCGTPLNPTEGDNWTIPIPSGKPPVEKIVQPELFEVPSLRILHLSDIHFDPKYVVGSEADCGEPQCCRKTPTTPVKQPAGQWGTLAKCDAPMWMVEDLFERLSKTEKFDVIYWTGDLPPHADWEYTQEQHLWMLHNLTDMFLKYFPKTPVFWAVGNHEGVPIDSFPPHYVPSEYSNEWLYDTLAGLWNYWLPDDTIPSIKWRASYAVKVMPGFRVISINTHWLYINQTDPDGTLAWLTEQLLDAEKAGDKVHIIGHVPGDGGFHGFANNYYDIVNRFENTIRGQFFGHTHRDSFNIFYEDADYKKRPTSVSYIAPSVTTYDGIQPAYRIYTVDGNHKDSTFTVLNHETWFLDVNESNFLHQPQWKFEYSAKESYKMKSTLPEDWNNLISRMEKDDTLFEKYRWFNGRVKPSLCTGACKRSELCNLRIAREDNGKLCPKTLNDDNSDEIITKTWRFPVDLIKKPQLKLDKCPF